MPEPSIVNWLNNDIDDGEVPSCFYIADLANHDGFMTLGYCKLTDEKRINLDQVIGQVRYTTSLDEMIISEQNLIALKDCWLLEQFLLIQLKEYKVVIPELMETGWRNYTETIRFPDLGESNFIEWIIEAARKILINPYYGYELCLESLITTTRQRRLYDKVLSDWKTLQKE